MFPISLFVKTMPTGLKTETIYVNGEKKIAPGEEKLINFSLW